MNKLGKTIKEKNIKQVELARHLGVSKQRVHNWIRGKYMPSADLIKPISAYLNIPIDELFFND